MKIDTKKIGLFLKSMDGAEYLYMQQSMEIRNSIERLIKRYNLSKQDVCQRFKIKPLQYNNYVKGNYNYSVMDMARINACFMELEMEKLKDNVPIQVAQSTNS